jgi:phosphoesterase RecJ-like protein
MFTKAMREENEITDEDIGDIVNCIRSIEGVKVAVSIKQTTNDENKYSISSRSNCDIDVSKACAKIGGGGHVRAAGATLYAESPNEAEQTIIELFSKLIK